MIKMTAIKTTRYAGKAIAAGAGFSVKSAMHARLLAAVGKARLAAEAVAPPPAVEPARPKRGYKRRDMVAEAPAVTVTELQVEVVEPAPAIAEHAQPQDEAS